MDGGGLDLRGEEGREGDLGDQCGAGIVDERIDLLGLLAAGFDLENSKTICMGWMSVTSSRAHKSTSHF